MFGSQVGSPAKSKRICNNIYIKDIYVNTSNLNLTVTHTWDRALGGVQRHVYLIRSVCRMKFDFTLPISCFDRPSGPTTVDDLRATYESNNGGFCNMLTTALADRLSMEL